MFQLPFRLGLLLLDLKRDYQVINFSIRTYDYICLNENPVRADSCFISVLEQYFRFRLIEWVHLHIIVLEVNINVLRIIYVIKICREQIWPPKT